MAARKRSVWPTEVIEPSVSSCSAKLTAVRLADGQRHGGGGEGPIEPHAAGVDDCVLEQVTALGLAQRLELRRMQHRPGRDDVERAALVDEVEKRGILVPGRNGRGLTLALSLRPRDRQHRPARRRILPVRQAERLGELAELGRIGVGEREPLAAMLDLERDRLETIAGNEDVLENHAFEGPVVGNQLPGVRMAGNLEEHLRDRLGRQP